MALENIYNCMIVKLTNDWQNAIFWECTWYVILYYNEFLNFVSVTICTIWYNVLHH